MQNQLLSLSFTKWIGVCCFLCLGGLNASSLLAAEIQLKLATLANGHHAYYHELLEVALKDAGHQLEIEITQSMPQKRIIKLLESGQLSLHFMVQSAARDELFAPIEVGLTNSLIGHRILFIPKGKSEAYSDVNTLDDFRKLGFVGAFGKGWFDVNVWKANQLNYLEEDGDWKKIYRKLQFTDRGIDYFSRGFVEILNEAQTYPNLEIEPRLMLIYDRDFRFYLSQSAVQHKAVIETALKQAKENGMIDKLLREYFAKDFEALKFDERVKIPLALN